MVIISTKFHEDTTLINLSYGPDKVQMTHCVTLTFDIESWVLYVTHLLIIINILTKLYENPTIPFEVTIPDKVRQMHVHTSAQTDARTDTQKLQIVATMSRSLQAGLTKMK